MGDVPWPFGPKKSSQSRLSRRVIVSLCEDQYRKRFEGHNFQTHSKRSDKQKEAERLVDTRHRGHKNCKAKMEIGDGIAEKVRTWMELATIMQVTG
jgi:hypothetical protein